MSDTPVSQPTDAAVAAPVAQTEDEQLAALLGAPAADAEAPVVAEAAPEAAPAEPTLEAKLAEIPEDTVPDEATPPAKDAINPEHQRVLSLFPSAVVAEQAQVALNNYANVMDTLSSNDYGRVEHMFNQWNPAFLEGFMEHVYAQKVASGQWVERWIAEKEGANPVINKELTSLQKQIAALESRLQGEDKQRQTAQQQRALSEAKAGYNKHIDSLFDQIKFAPGDRKWVQNEITKRVEADPAALQAVLAGKPIAATKHFKAVVLEYAQRDKEVAQIKNDKQTVAEQHKQPVQASAQPVGPITDEQINALPKGSREDAREAKLDQDLTSFLNSARKR